MTDRHSVTSFLVYFGTLTTILKTSDLKRIIFRETFLDQKLLVKFVRTVATNKVFLLFMRCSFPQAVCFQYDTSKPSQLLETVRDKGCLFDATAS